MWLWLETHFAVLLGMILALMAISHLLGQRRSPSSLIAWLLIIILLPYIGVPLYLLFGGRKMVRIARSKEKIELDEGVMLPLEQATAVDRGLRTCGIPGAMTGNNINLCRSGEEAYHGLVQMIDKASRSIYLTTFIFAEDEVGADILLRLGRKAAVGVKVRLLMDGVGSLKTSTTFLEPLVQAGGRYAFFMPVFHHPLRGRTNLRNHRKIVIVDDCTVWAGGQNIAGVYLGPHKQKNRWQDLSFILNGSAVAPFVKIFLSDWFFAASERLEIRHNKCPSSGGDSIVQVVPSGPDMHRDALYEAIIAAIFAAEKRLWIVTPYFVPDHALCQSMIIAAHRGVDVRIVVPKKSNHVMADIVRSGYLREIQAAGGTIVLYTGSMLHAKVILIDEALAMVGSANLDSRSLFLNYEVATFFYSEDDILEVKKWIERVAADSVTGIAEAGRLRSLFEGMAQVIAPQV